MAEDQRSMSIRWSIRERAKIDTVAAQHNMNTSSFIRLILLGVLAEGGGTLDKMLAKGARSSDLEVRSRAGENPDVTWPSDGDMHRRHKDGQWEMIKFGPRGMSTRAKGSNDPQNWWHLGRTGSVDLIPLAFVLKDAIALAEDYMIKADRMMRRDVYTEEVSSTPEEP